MSTNDVIILISVFGFIQILAAIWIVGQLAIIIDILKGIKKDE